jgi:membrane associated rhomboid family serine protease
MLPIGDEDKGIRLQPVVNLALIAINVIVFIYQATLSEEKLFEFIVRWGTIPEEISSGKDLFTLLTCMFLHGGWLHLGGNMLFLWVFGNNIEDTMGHVRYLLFYLLCGLAASGLQVLINTDSEVPLVGASGAISGVLAAYLVLFPHGKIRTLLLIGIPLMILVPAWGMIGYWIVIQFINGLLSLGVETAETQGGVAYFAHIGGFIAGAALVFLFRDREIQERHQSAREGSQAFQRSRVFSR